jgi:hypothetical protein
MKKLILFLLLATQIAVGQGNSSTGTTKSGKYQMNSPDVGTRKDSAVVWDGVTKLMKILPVSEIKGTTNLNKLATPTGVIIYSDTGADAVLPLGTTTNAGLQSPTDKTKLDGIATGATANDTDANLKNRSNHTGTQVISTVTGLQTALDSKVDKITGKGLSTEDYTTAEKTKLSGIQDGATANSTDAQLRDRTTHTGTQAINTVIGLQAAIDAKINISLIGANNGLAPLDAGGKVPFSVLPASLMIYKGMWNPATNTPTLADGTGVAGWVYKASVDGTVNLGSGNIVFVTSDFAIHNGTKWEFSNGTDAVVSVNGQQGVVSLNTSHIQETTNKRYQTDAQNNNNDATSSIQTQLNGKQPAGSYVYTNDSRLSDARPASDVWSWAKLSTKPSYTYYEVGAEPSFSKNTAFNKNFGTAAGTVAEGNDSRINNGQTAFSWGNHAGLYLPTNGNAVSATELYTASYGGANLNTAALGKHVNYSSIWLNSTGAPNTASYGTAYNLGGSSSSVLSLQLLADVVHNSTSSTKDLYFRTGNNLGFQADWKTILHSGNFNSYSPTLTGVGATGTWGINISGNAGSANVWSGLGSDFSASISTAPSYILGYTTSTAKPYNSDGVKAFLGLGSNAYTSTAYLPLTGGTMTGSISSNLTNALGAGVVGSGTPYRLYASGDVAYGIGVNGNTGGMEYMANQAAAGFGHKFYGGADNTAPKLLMTIQSNGNLDVLGNVVATGFFNQSSDRRLKDIHKRDGDVAYFTWKDKRDSKLHIGYIAQEVKKQFPYQVQKDDKGMLSVSYIEILVAKVQALEKRIQKLEKKK